MVDGLVTTFHDGKHAQEQIDDVCKKLCMAFAAEAETMAKMTIEETGMGDFESKIMKNMGCPAGAWAQVREGKSVGVIGEDKAKKLRFTACLISSYRR